MPTTYRIRNWNEHFENNRTRDIKHLTSVLVPNKMDGDGYTELLSGHEQGYVHYAAWVAILLVASKCRPRGTLVRESAVPHDSSSLARLTRMPSHVFDEAIPRLIAVGWLEEMPIMTQQVTSIPQEGAVKPHDGAGLPQASEDSFAYARAPTKPNQTEPNLTQPAGGSGGPEIELKCLDDIDDSILKNDDRLALLTKSLHEERPDLFPDNIKSLINVISAATKASKETETPTRLFRWLIRTRNWERCRDYKRESKSRAERYITPKNGKPA